MRIPSIALFVFCLICCDLTWAQPAGTSNLNLCRATFIGGRGKTMTQLMDICIDAQGNVYGCGYSSSFPVTSGPPPKGGVDAFVVKLNPQLNQIIWATYIGGANYDCAGSIALTQSGDVVVTGVTYSANFPVSKASDAAYLANGQAAIFVAKFGPSGSPSIYSRVLGRSIAMQQTGANADRAAYVAIDATGNTFVLSQTNSAQFNISAAARQNALAGGIDLTLSKLDAVGNLSYSSYLGGSGDDLARGLVYANSQLYACGSTNSNNLPAMTTTPVGADAFVMGLSDQASGIVPLNGMLFGSAANDIATSISVDVPRSRICVTGLIGMGTILTNKALQQGQGSGGFISSIDIGFGTINWFTVLGTNVEPRSSAVVSNGSIYIGAFTSAQSATAPVTSNAWQVAPKSKALEGCLMHLDGGGMTLLNGTYHGGVLDEYGCAVVRALERPCATSVYYGLNSHSSDFPTPPDKNTKNNGGYVQATVSMFSAPSPSLVQLTSTRCTSIMDGQVSCGGTIVAAQWDCGDGLQESGLAIQHRYAHSGKYVVTITMQDSAGSCLKLMQNFETEFTQADAGPDIFKCDKDTVFQLNAGPAASYRWSPAADFSDPTIRNPSVHPKKSTNYYLTTVDIYGCVSSDTVGVYLDSFSPRVTKDTTICSGSTVRLTAYGGSKFRWKPDSALADPTLQSIDVSPMTTTTYRVVVTAGYCVDTQMVTVTVVPKPKLYMFFAQNLCVGTALQLQPSLTDTSALDTAGMTVEWSPLTDLDNPTSLTPSVHPSQTTTYTLRLKLKGGCELIDSTKVIVGAGINMQCVADTGICLGAYVQLWAQGATSYTWDPPEGLTDAHTSRPYCTPTRDMEYTVTGVSGSCTDTKRVRVHALTRPRLKLNADTTVCQYQMCRLSVRDPESDVRYEWTPAPDSIFNNGAEVIVHQDRTTTYRCTATRGSSCSVSDSVRLHIANTLQLQVTDSVSVCDGDAARISILSPSDPLTQYYLPTTPGLYDSLSRSFVVNIQGVGEHPVVVHAQRGECGVDDTTYVTVRSHARIQATTDTLICNGSTLALNASVTTTPQAVIWLRDGKPDSLVINPTSLTTATQPLTETTAFHLRVTADGCESQHDILVRVAPKRRILRSIIPSICPGQFVELFTSMDAMKSITWSPSTGLNRIDSTSVIARPLVSTRYTAHMVDTLGCATDVQMDVLMNPTQLMTVGCSSILGVTSGIDTTISIVAASDSTVTGLIVVDCSVRADAFVSDDPGVSESIVGDRRIMQLRLNNAQITNVEREIYQIHGRVLFSVDPVSDITIDNVQASGEVCIQTTVKPGVITTASCYQTGRGIMLVTPLAMSIHPQPVGSLLEVQCNSAPDAVVECQVIDMLGRVRLRTTLASAQHDHHISLDGCEDGIYEVVFLAASQRQSQTIVKIAD